MRFIPSLVLTLLALLPGAARAQKAQNYWYFGYHAGISFNGPTPVGLDDGQLATIEGSASIADERTGVLMFYTDGVTVWNRYHQPMPRGTNLLGAETSTQTALIVPATADTARYYLFTTGAGPYYSVSSGLTYSIVDMTENFGLGDVVEKNIPLLPVASEKLTGIKLPDGSGYWVIAHGWGDNAFHAYMVTGAGISGPVISRVGSVHGNDPQNSIGFLKASPNGRRVVSVIYEDAVVELFDFDPLTGTLSNPVRVRPDIGWTKPYGASFSADNSKLYISAFRPGLFQFDLAWSTETEIAASARVFPNVPGTRAFMALQLGPDGRIYCAAPGAALTTDQIYVIDSANDAGARLALAGINLRSAFAAWGLPNMIDTRVQATNLVVPNSQCPPQSRDMRLSRYQYALQQNTPNPFAETTVFRYTIALEAWTRMEIVSQLGERVAMLVDEVRQPGHHAVTWNAGDRAPGVYHCRIESGPWRAFMRITIVE